MRAGLETGVYFFAQAVTVEEAIEEADYVISLLDGLDINGPVAYDWEMHDSTYGSTAHPRKWLPPALWPSASGSRTRGIPPWSTAVRM